MVVHTARWNYRQTNARPVVNLSWRQFFKRECQRDAGVAIEQVRTSTGSKLVKPWRLHIVETIG
jgi:hypothetical protein